MKRMIFGGFVVFLLMTLAAPVVAVEETAFLFQGLEVTEGRDMGDTRYGTRFVGEVLDE